MTYEQCSMISPKSATCTQYTR